MNRGDMPLTSSPRPGARRAFGAAILVLGWLSAAGIVVAEGPADLGAAASVEQAVIKAIARAESSVVAIARVQKPEPGRDFPLEFRPDPFGRRAVPYSSPSPTDPDFVPSQYGTGVVVDPGGLILTANHILGDRCDYYVTTKDRRIFAATVKGADPRSDLAVLAIQAHDLEPIVLGDVGGVRKGQIVIALGNPYAIARDGQVSASWGIVSNLARKAPPLVDEDHPTGKSTLHHFGTLIQTDAKLNLGTSGGPLLNLQGEMIGLTTALAATAGYEQSAGYAYPVDETFCRVVDTLKRGREVEYGFLGVSPAPLSLDARLAGIHGTRLDWVVPGMPAERAGLRPGDFVTAVNGRPIYDADGLVLEVGRLPVEATVRLTVVRDSRTLDIEAALTKYRVLGRQIVTEPAPRWRGMRVEYLSAVLDAIGRGGGGALAFDDGVVVTHVDEASPAWEAGVRPGMLVRRVNGEPVGTPGQFRRLVRGKSGAVRLQLADSRGENPSQATVQGS